MSIFTMIMLCTLTSCEEDDWMTRSDISGSWNIVEVTEYSGQCPYWEGDRLVFDYDGHFTAYGRNGFSESGLWDVSHDVIQIDFDSDGRTDVIATIESLDHGYLRLDIDDRSYNSKYTLRLNRW